MDEEEEEEEEEGVFTFASVLVCVCVHVRSFGGSCFCFFLLLPGRGGRRRLETVWAGVRDEGGEKYSPADSSSTFPLCFLKR